MNQTLGEVLKELRERKNISLREVAKQAKLSPAHLSDIEWGRRFPSPGTLEAIAKVLGVDVATLQQHDNRPPVDELRQAMRRDPAMGFALRRAMDVGVSSEDIFKLVKSKGGSGTK